MAADKSTATHASSNGGWRAWLAPAILVLALLAIWQALVWVLRLPEYLLPTPTRLVGALVNQRALLAGHAWATLQEILAGFALGCTIAYLLGIGMFYSRTLERALYPLAILSQVTPKIALAPLFLIWFGYGMLPKVVISALVCFFPVLVNTTRGLASVQPELLDVLSSIAATRSQILRKVRIPAAMPFLFSALKVAVGLSVVGATIGEFVGADRGLGYVIMVANTSLDTPLLFTALIWLALEGIALFVVVCGLERLLVPAHLRTGSLGVGESL